MENKKVLFTIDENNENYKKYINEVYGDKKDIRYDLIEKFNNDYIYTHFPSIYDELIYMSVEKDLVITAYNDEYMEYFIHFESNKIYCIFKKYSNKDLFYIQVFGFNLNIKSEDILNNFKVIETNDTNEISIPSYILSMEIGFILEDNRENKLIDIKYKYFYNESSDIIYENNFFNNLELYLSYFNGDSLKLFIDYYNINRSRNDMISSSEYNEILNDINNIKYLSFKSDLTFEIEDRVFYFEKGKVYKFIDFDCNLWCYPYMDDSYFMNDNINFITYKDIIFKNSELVEGYVSFVYSPNFVSSRDDIFTIHKKIFEKYFELYDDDLYCLKINDTLQSYSNLKEKPFEYLFNVRCLLYGRVIKDYINRYRNSI